ncbi:CRISPR-associated endonuclease Cas1 [Streptomyces sp. NPDC059152]|uniref:CRISPR-associated endonuclease Cas1 n=1 Tax=Streptomyces sp. NPDC059152 TaxID=3346742 RepID=UPI0036B1FD62
MTNGEIPELAEIFAPRTIGPTLIVEGFGAKLAVERGQLVVHDGFGPHRRTNKLSRIERRVERIIITAVDGYVTIDAMRWCKNVGISVVMLDPAGDVIMTSPADTYYEGRLHRAQAQGNTEAVRYIMDRKITGQYEVSGHPKIKDHLIRLQHDVDTIREITAIEAKTSRYYWGSIRGTKVTFRGDVPEHWTTFQTRSSALQYAGKTPRKATTPFNAMLNLGYSIGYAEARLACHALGLDTELGLLHRPKEAKSHSMALDLIEIARPHVDRMVLDLVSERTFTRKDFYETNEGQCTVGSPLDREIIERARKAVQEPLAEATEDVAHILAESCDTKIKKRTPLTKRTLKATH